MESKLYMNHLRWTFHMIQENISLTELNKEGKWFMKEGEVTSRT